MAEEEKKIDDGNVDDEVVKTALKITSKVWSQMKEDSLNQSEEDILKQYISLCPFVSRDSRAVQVALDGIDAYTKSKSSSALSPAKVTAPVSVVKDKSVSNRPKAGTPVIKKEAEGSLRAINKTAKGGSGQLLRYLLLDLPLFMLLLTCSAMRWMHHVHDNYLLHQLQDAVFSEDRVKEEVTYYVRPCTADDISTSNPTDLYLPETATAEEAAEHQMQHGFTIIPRVLSSQTAEDLRTFIDARSKYLKGHEKFFVSKGKFRYSFGLGSEEPTFRQAMKEMANNVRFRSVLEKIMGPDPAVLEMTAITSSYGAESQYWHSDTVHVASATNFAQTFGPSYSVFIQLQNTTKEMGATGACPGTHYCTQDDIDDYCDQRGFHVVGEDGHWAAGDALIMNMDAFHRGSAHVDPNGPDRVMLIISFAPRPRDRMEKRQISEGITFSMRWDMYGNTLQDLAKIDISMRHPWAYLRALGLHKPGSSSWGIDFLSCVTMRMANGDVGFTKDDFKHFLKRGGFRLLPSFLQPDVEEGEYWHEYITGTFLLIESFIWKLVIVITIWFAALYLMATIETDSLTPAAEGLCQYILYTACAFLCYELARRHVDATNWAADIKAHRRYSGTTESEFRFAQPHHEWPTTFPTKYDVLFETRYGSRYLHNYNNFISGHPANRFYRTLLERAAPTFVAYPFEFQQASAAYIVSVVSDAHGRFLHQDPDGAWRWMDNASATEQTKRNLAIASSGLRSALGRELRLLESDLKHGILQDTPLAYKHAKSFLRDLGERLLNVSKKDIGRLSTVARSTKRSTPPGGSMWSSFRLGDCTTNARPIARSTSAFPPAKPFTEPSMGAWLTENDIVEAHTGNYWTKGKIRSVIPHGQYDVEFQGEGAYFLAIDKVRPVAPLVPGEQLEVKYLGKFRSCKVLRLSDDNTYEALLLHSKKNITGLKEDDFRRPAETEKEPPPVKPRY